MRFSFFRIFAIVSVALLNNLHLVKYVTKDLKNYVIIFLLVSRARRRMNTTTYLESNRISNKRAIPRVKCGRFSGKFFVLQKNVREGGRSYWRQVARKYRRDEREARGTRRVRRARGGRFASSRHVHWTRRAN